MVAVSQPLYKLDVLLKYKALNKTMPMELAIFLDQINEHRRRGGEMPTISTIETIMKKMVEKTGVSSELLREMNKLNKDNYDATLKKILSCKIETNDELCGFVSLVLSKAMNDRISISNYAMLCSDVKNRYIVDSDKKIYFKNILCNKCQLTFDSIIKNESKESKMSNTNFCIFLGELYNEDVLPQKIILICLDELIKTIELGDSLSCLCEFFPTIRDKLEEDKEELCDGYILKIKGLLKTCFLTPSQRKQSFLLLNLIENIESQ